MTDEQAARLRYLAQLALEPDAFKPGLERAEAERRIAALEAKLRLLGAVPQPIVARLNRALNEVLGESEAQAGLSAQGLDAEPGTPDTLRSRIAGDIERWRTIVAAAGIQPE